jgi:hypothetical protein
VWLTRDAVVVAPRRSLVAPRVCAAILADASRANPERSDVPVEASYQDEHEDIPSWCWIVLLEDSKMEGLRVAEFVMAAFMGKWIPVLVDGARREL